MTDNTIDNLAPIEAIPAETAPVAQQGEQLPAENEKKAKKDKKKRKRMPGWLKTIMILAIIVGIAAGGYFVWASFNGKTATSQYTEIIVDRGIISNQVSGSGSVEAVNQQDITTMAKGDVIESYFEEGQQVKKGDLLYKIDTKDVENSIESSKLSVQRAQNTYNDEVKKVNDTNAKLAIKSDSNGVITKTYLKNGDKVQDKSQIADVVDSSTMLLTLPFIAEQADQVYSGQAATVSMANSSNKYSGTVNRVQSGQVVSGDGIAVKNVEIYVENPGSIKKGDKATAIVGSIACNDIGTFDDRETFTIYAKTAGDLTGFNKKVGDSVSAGEVIARINNDDTTNNIASNELSLKDANLKLQNQYDQLDNYNVTSPIDGQIIKKTTKVGDTVGGSSSSDNNSVMAIVADMSKIIFKLNIDELDIEKIKVDQKVDITADALPNKKFTGYVEYISIVGTSSNGVTSYPVTIVIEEPTGLIPGMNVNAVIVVEQKDNVVRIPVSALGRGNTVMIKSADGAQGGPQGQGPGQGQGGQRQWGGQGQGQGQRQGGQGNGQTPNAAPGQGQAGQTPAASGQSQDGQAPAAGGGQGQNGRAQTGAASGQGQTGGVKMMGAGQNLPADARIAMVQTGISDKDYIEITSGLKVGDVIYIRKQESTTTTQQNAQFRMGGAGGMGGGGAMPAGGGNWQGGGAAGGANRTTGGQSGGGAAR